MVDEMEVIVAWYDSKWYLQHVLWFLSMITNLPVHQRYPKSSLEACSEKVFSRPESDQISFKTCREIRIWPNHSSVVSEHVVFCSSRDGIRKKPSFVLSLDTYRNQSWACFEPPPRRKAATAQTGVWTFVKLRFVRFKGRWSSRGDWTPGLERKNIFIEKPSFIESDRLWTSTIIKNQVSAIILRFCRATAGPWHSRHIFGGNRPKSGPPAMLGVRTH